MKNLTLHCKMSTTTYVIEAKNTGTSPATNVRLTDTLPEEMAFLSATFPIKGKRRGQKLLFDPYPILQPGQKLTFKLECKALRQASAKNRAELTYDQFDSPILDEEGTSIYE